MKTELTIEESAKLIELGIDPKLASKRTNGQSYEDYCLGNPVTPEDIKPIFTLTDILNILPPATRDLGGVMYGFSVERGTWVAEYDDCPDSCKYGEELIDALGEILDWYLRSGYVVVGHYRDEQYTLEKKFET